MGGEMMEADGGFEIQDQHAEMIGLCSWSHDSNWNNGGFPYDLLGGNDRRRPIKLVMMMQWIRRWRKWAMILFTVDQGGLDWIEWSDGNDDICINARTRHACWW